MPVKTHLRNKEMSAKKDRKEEGEWDRSSKAREK